VHTQFTSFGDDGNELRKQCSFKINTRPEDTRKWIECFREKMIEIYDLEERPVQHGYQFALCKNGSKYVSATIYNTGTMLVQGLVANGVKFPFSIASPVSCSEFSTMGVVVVNSLFNEIICFRKASTTWLSIRAIQKWK
jgi:hypothetical protein